MNATRNPSRFTPEGWRIVTPRIVTRGAQELVAFIKQVFGVTGEYRSDRPAVLNIGDSMIMISDAGSRKPMPAFLYVYVEDADATYRRAILAGATSMKQMDVGQDPIALAAQRLGNRGLKVDYEQLKKTSVPTLLVCGSLDNPARFDPLRAILPHAEFVTIEGSRHGDAPGNPEFAKAVRAFLTHYSKE